MIKHGGGNSRLGVPTQDEVKVMVMPERHYQNLDERGLQINGDPVGFVPEAGGYAMIKEQPGAVPQSFKEAMAAENPPPQQSVGSMSSQQNLALLSSVSSSAVKTYPAEAPIQYHPDSGGGLRLNLVATLQDSIPKNFGGMVPISQTVIGPNQGQPEMHRSDVTAIPEVHKLLTSAEIAASSPSDINPLIVVTSLGPVRISSDLIRFSNEAGAQLNTANIAQEQQQRVELTELSHRANVSIASSGNNASEPPMSRSELMDISEMTPRERIYSSAPTTQTEERIYSPVQSGSESQVTERLRAFSVTQGGSDSELSDRVRVFTATQSVSDSEIPERIRLFSATQHDGGGGGDSEISDRVRVFPVTNERTTDDFRSAPEERTMMPPPNSGYREEQRFIRKSIQLAQDKYIGAHVQRSETYGYDTYEDMDNT